MGSELTCPSLHSWPVSNVRVLPVHLPRTIKVRAPWKPRPGAACLSAAKEKCEFTLRTCKIRPYRPRHFAEILLPAASQTSCWAQPDPCDRAATPAQRDLIHTPSLMGVRSMLSGSSSSWDRKILRRLRETLAYTESNYRGRLFLKAFLQNRPEANFPRFPLRVMSRGPHPPSFLKAHPCLQ